MQVNNMDNEALKKIIDDRLEEKMKREYASFTQKRVADTPTDALQIVNRKYVTLNGSSTNRPVASVIGQQYFDTDLASGRGKPVWWNGTGFVDATGTYV